MNKTEKRIISIAKSLGGGGRTFSTDDISKVDKFILEAMINNSLAQGILNGILYVGIENGELLFSNDPAKFNKKGK